MNWFVGMSTIGLCAYIVYYVCHHLTGKRLGTFQGDPNLKGRRQMGDLIFVTATFLFFVISAGFTCGLDRLSGESHQ